MDNSPPVEQQLEQGTGSGMDEGSSAAAKKSRRKTVVVVAIAAALGLCLCVCVVAGGWSMLTGIIRGALERDDVTAVIDEFMQAMEMKDADAAYALFSTRAQRQMPQSGLEEGLGGNNYVLFEGYESVELTHFAINAAFSTNPDAPQGTVAQVSGTVAYQGEIRGSLTAV
ncbi:MAG: hypothetical protein GWN58_45370, partial [Anaerolineae bacterium]|nr:hypothetical protein [Anaerolineae bacterium]